MVLAINILYLVTVAVLLTGCGGGGNSDIGGNGGSGSAPTAQTESVSAPSTQTGTQNGTPLENTGNPPVDNNPDNGYVTPSDRQLTGRLSVVGNQLVYIRENRSAYHPVSLSAFESDAGIFDIASGSKGGDAGAPVPAPALAPAAPIAAFGIRIDKFVKPSALQQELGNQTVVGRVAVELSERTDSPGIVGQDAPETMKFVIDGVELRTDAYGELVFAGVQAGMRMHVYGRNAAGVEVRETIPVPAGAVRLLPMSQVPDNQGDITSIVLLLDLETAFSQAGAKLTALENIAGHFEAHVTMSAGELIRPAQDATATSPALDRKFLIGREIAVTGQSPVNGAGISGNAWIRMNPPR